jgi:type I restriction-modification system DNA methylase subunit
MQLNLFNSSGISAAVAVLATQGGIEARGAIFTRVEVVDFILDLVGYTEDQPLYHKRLLEPSFGGGDFLLPVVGRLLNTWRASKNGYSVVEELGDSLRAVELHRETFAATRGAVIERIKHEGIAAKSAIALADRWVMQGDFLLEPPEGQFDFVVGNPPYVRQ